MPGSLGGRAVAPGGMVSACRLTDPAPSPPASPGHRWRRFFDGLELAEPGLVSTPQWRPGAGVSPRPLPGWAGVARKT